jgi:8-oxo-dGTP pyrophosphatase MutT (NUDIX family)
MAEASRRCSLGAAAVICCRDSGQLRWLARWNKNWRCYYLVGGHKHEDETFRQCLAREISEELDLAEGDDYGMGATPCQRLEYDAWSESAKRETHYEIELFAVKLSDAVERSLPRSRREVRWLSREEIENGACADGQPVSPTLSRMAAAVGWGCPWSSACKGQPKT